MYFETSDLHMKAALECRSSRETDVFSYFRDDKNGIFLLFNSGDKRARMAVTCMDQIFLPSMPDEELEGSDYLTLVSKLVSKHKHKTIILKSPAGATWTVGDLEDTIYRGKENVVNGWNKFYLSDIVDMQVMGVVEGTSCPCDQLVLMTCEDGNLYAYDGDELHLVASSLKQLRVEGIKYPADTSYYKGEAFQKMTDEDWDEVRSGPVGKRLDEEHHKLVTENKSEFLKNLSSIKPKTGACS